MPAAEQCRLARGLAHLAPAGAALAGAGAVQIAKGQLVCGLLLGRGREGAAGRGGTGVEGAKGGGVVDLAGAVAGGLETAVLGAAGDAFAGPGRCAGWICAAV